MNCMIRHSPPAINGEGVPEEAGRILPKTKAGTRVEGALARTITRTTMASRAKGRAEGSWVHMCLKGATQSTDGMARIRVYAKTADGKRTPMIGLIPQESLDQVKERMLAAYQSGVKHVHLEARVKELQTTDVIVEAGTDPIPARKMILGIRVRGGAPRASELESSLMELILDAERVRESALKSGERAPERERSQIELSDA
jgi:hypothetical protein